MPVGKAADQGRFAEENRNFLLQVELVSFSDLQKVRGRAGQERSAQNDAEECSRGCVPRCRQ